MTASTRWQEVIAENLTASAVPGFRKQDITVAAVEAGLLPNQGAVPGGSFDFAMPRATVATDFTPGQIRHTGVSTDVAIEGRAFFEVQLPDGRTAYTRDGEFHVNSRGQLITKQGFLVLGETGPIQLDPNGAGPMDVAIAVSPEGVVSQGMEERGRLKLTTFGNPELLAQVPGGLFLGGHPQLLELPDAPSSVRWRCLEGANTSPVAEMASLLTAMRTFESNQRLIQLQDERMGKVIQELSNA